MTSSCKGCIKGSDLWLCFKEFISLHWDKKRQNVLQGFKEVRSPYKWEGFLVVLNLGLDSERGGALRHRKTLWSSVKVARPQACVGMSMSPELPPLWMSHRFLKPNMIKTELYTLYHEFVSSPACTLVSSWPSTPFSRSERLMFLNLPPVQFICM